MNQLKAILATALSGALLFTACKKENYTQLTNGTAATPGTARPGPLMPDTATFISYQVATVASPDGAMLQWNAGTANTATMTLDATRMNGEALHLVNYSATVPVYQQQHRLYQTLVAGNLALPH